MTVVRTRPIHSCRQPFWSSMLCMPKELSEMKELRGTSAGVLHHTCSKLKQLACRSHHMCPSAPGCLQLTFLCPAAAAQARIFFEGGDAAEHLVIHSSTCRTGCEPISAETGGDLNSRNHVGLQGADDMREDMRPVWPPRKLPTASSFGTYEASCAEWWYHRWCRTFCSSTCRMTQTQCFETRHRAQGRLRPPAVRDM